MHNARFLEKDFPEIRNVDSIIFDFDGVIKESVSIKTNAYCDLFYACDKKLKSQIRDHHMAHSGMSRYEKIPLYLSWAGEEITKQKIEKFCTVFSEKVVDAVINSDWVPGVLKFLQNNRMQTFILVTATPIDEILQILDRLDIRKCFHSIYGAPDKKNHVVSQLIKQNVINANSTIFIGDSKTDMDAALENEIAFYLRVTPDNVVLSQNYDGPKFHSFGQL